MRLHEKVGLYGLLLPLLGLLVLAIGKTMFEPSSRAALIRTDVVGSRGRVHLADPACSCGGHLDPEMKGAHYWEATCPSCGREWHWGVDFRETISGRALSELAISTNASAVGNREVPPLAEPSGLVQGRVALGEATRRISRIPVTSSALRSVGFEASSSTLEIEFVSGSVYQYFDVPRSVYAGLLAAPSKGRHFNSHVRDAGFGYVRVR